MEEIGALFAEIEKKYPAQVNEVSLKRGDFLLRQGQVERFTYLILEGAVVVKRFNESDDHLIRFGYRGSFLNSLPSFFDDSPSRFAILAIRKTRVKRFAKEAVFDLVRSKPAWKDAYIAILENLAAQFVEREIDLLTSSPAERYGRILTRSPRLFEEVPLRYIAEYLRMTPETLSRLRKS
jgi:CRP-like cAMP-binding protein